MFAPARSDEELRRLVLAGAWAGGEGAGAGRGMAGGGAGVGASEIEWPPLFAESQGLWGNNSRDANRGDAWMDARMDELFPLVLSRRGLGFAEQVLLCI